ncbi:hypothetical protein OAZ15_04710, partial [Pelagibacteraceae bacterium]|nr:hypothetical protein [Pelagibacteraceae bacterium]
QTNQKDNYDNFMYKIKFLISKLETLNSYSIYNQKIIENLKINLDFNLLNINLDPEYINVKEETVNSFLFYLISSIIMFLLYVIYVLILLGYRNR